MASFVGAAAASAPRVRNSRRGPVVGPAVVRPAEGEESEASGADVALGAYLLSHLQTHRCEACGVSSTPQWRKGWISDVLQRAVLLCNACGIKYHKSQYCTYCCAIYGKEVRAGQTWLQCDGCRKLLHRKCEDQCKQGAWSLTGSYVCPDCACSHTATHGSAEHVAAVAAHAAAAIQAAAATAVVMPQVAAAAPPPVPFASELAGAPPTHSAADRSPLTESGGSSGDISTLVGIPESSSPVGSPPPQPAVVTARSVEPCAAASDAAAATVAMAQAQQVRQWQEQVPAPATAAVSAAQPQEEPRPVPGSPLPPEQRAQQQQPEPAATIPRQSGFVVPTESVTSPASAETVALQQYLLQLQQFQQLQHLYLLQQQQLQ